MVTAGARELAEIILPVKDMDSQVLFYRDVLGLHVKEPQGVKDFREFFTVKLDVGSCLLVLHSGSEQRIGEDAPRLVFRVENIQKARHTLLEKGVLMGEIQTPAPETYTCDGNDPEGNAFSLESRNKKEVTPTVTTVIDNTVFSSPYVSANSRRGRSILLLRHNKLIIAIEILCFLALLLVFPYLGYADFIVIYLIVAALIWLRGTSWSELGLSQPVRWRSTLTFGISFFFIYLFLDTVVIAPLLFRFFHQQPHVGLFTSIHGNLAYLFGGVLTAWTHAGFGEEMIYRGYLLNRVTDLFGRKPLGWTIALFVQAIGFALGHLYQGMSGVVNTIIYALLIGCFYLIIRRNLWACAIAHALSDSLSFLLVFFGL